MTASVRLTLLHGNRRGQAERFTLSAGGGIVFGRDPSCDVRYTKDDDLVSRRHLKITLKGARDPELLIEDLGSSNGTFVNGRRVVSPLKLQAGDVIRLGKGGPEAKVELESGAGKSVRPDSPAAAAAVIKPVQQGNRSRRGRALLLSAELAALCLAICFYLYAIRDDIGSRVQAAPPLEGSSSPGIADGVVLIERRWRMIDADSGQPLYRLFASNQVAAGDSTALVAGAGAYLPVFVTIDGKMEPVLATSDGGGRNPQVGGIQRTSGFFVANGTILTVGEPENHADDASVSRGTAGILLVTDNDLRVASRAGLVPEILPKLAALAESPVQGEIGSGGVRLGGRLRTRVSSETSILSRGAAIPVDAASVSDSTDRLEIHVADAREISPMQLSRDRVPGIPGDPVTILGYPAIPGTASPERSEALAVETTIASAADRSGSFELVPGRTRVCAGAPVLARSGKVIGILQFRGTRWFATVPRFGSEAVTAGQ